MLTEKLSVFLTYNLSDCYAIFVSSEHIFWAKHAYNINNTRVSLQASLCLYFVQF